MTPVMTTTDIPLTMVLHAASLGDAILKARDLVVGTAITKDGTRASWTVVQYNTLAGADRLRFGVIAAEGYAALREQGAHDHLTPLLSFLPHGGLDVHKASFEGLRTRHEASARSPRHVR